MTKAEKIAAQEKKVAELKKAYEEAEFELEKFKGGGPMLDQLFEMIDASDRSMEEVIEFLKG